MSIYYPGTTTLVTHSFDERILDAEFDDALVDQKAWKNSRYDGSRLKAKKANFFTESSSIWEGDSSYQNLAVLENQTTALYIANTVIGGTEDPQFATIKNHSYVGINKILLINTNDDSVQVLDRSSEPFQEFHRFITNDFPTGNKAKIKILDNSIATNLKGTHRVKMNKGYLLKTFSFHHAGESSGSLGSDPALTENNSMYLYQGGTFKDNLYKDGVAASSTDITLNSDQLRFRFGVLEIFEGGSNGTGGKFDINKAGPSFASSSILENKFTQQYYSGSYGFVKHQPSTTSEDSAEILAGSGLGSASRFIALDTLDFLRNNNLRTDINQQEKTELHITFFEGTKDFSKSYMPLGTDSVSSSLFGDPNGTFGTVVSANDERSIGTFEIDQNRTQLDVEQGGACNGGLPVNHEITFKGIDDFRFLPKLSKFNDNIQSAHLSGSAGACTNITASVESGEKLQRGLVLDRVDNAKIIVQGGALGQVGFFDAVSSSVGSYGIKLDNIGLFNVDTSYSGSFRYDLSFLDKDHTLILDLDKDAELFDGIGNDGVLIIPEFLHDKVEFNLEFYLQQAGIISSATPIALDIQTQNSIQN